MQPLIDEKQMAMTIGKSVQTLRNDRHLNRGLPYIKLGRSVRYSMEDIERFIDDRKIQTEDSRKHGD